MRVLPLQPRHSQARPLTRELVLLLAGSLAAATSAPAGDSPPWSKPRELPSLIVRWQRPGEPCALTIRDGTVYALEPGRVVALDGATGRLRWEHVLQTEHCPFHWQQPLLALESVVVVAVEERLRIIGRARGGRLHTLPLGGRFSQMWGPDVLVEAGDGQDKDLLAVDPVAGRVTGRRRFQSGIYELQAVGQNVLVTAQS